MLRLYDFLTSGNCYKVRLLLAQLERPYERVELDRFDGSVRSPEYLAINPLGQVPALVFEDGRVLVDSSAILFHLAEGTPYLPGDPFDRAQVIRWMMFEQPNLAEGLGTARYITTIMGEPEAHAEALADAQARGRAALGIMERHLAGCDFFVGGAYSIADLALHVYSGMADQAGVDLAPYPAVRAWLERVRGQPRHVGLTEV